jgi:hypothetical protein
MKCVNKSKNRIEITYIFLPNDAEFLDYLDVDLTLPGLPWTLLSFLGSVIQSFSVCVVIAGRFDAVNRITGNPAMVKAVAWSGEVVVGSKSYGFGRDDVVVIGLYLVEDCAKSRCLHSVTLHLPAPLTMPHGLVAQPLHAMRLP